MKGKIEGAIKELQIELHQKDLSVLKRYYLQDKIEFLQELLSHARYKKLPVN